MARPFFRVSAGGVDITSKLVGRGISLTISDGVGRESDTIQLEIDDVNGEVAAPRTGVILNVVGGYEDGPQRDFGDYKVDQVAYSGYPQKISISAQAVDAKSEQKQKRVLDYQVEDFPTYGDIFSAAAGRMGLELAISAEIKSKANPYEMQSEENDLSFSTRLGDKLDASVSVKSGRLVVMKRGKGTTVSGQQLPTIVVEYAVNVLSYNVTRKDKPKHSTVTATWFDRDEVERKEVSVSASAEGPDFLLRDPYASEAEAKENAEAKSKELQRGEASASFEIDGDPMARAEAYVEAIGLRDQVDGKWRATTVTHNFSSTSPYTTSIECELPDA
jgi:phage protein D